MTVVAGGTATPEGRAAMRRAASECVLRRGRLVVVTDTEFPRSPGEEELEASSDELENAAARLAGAGLQLERIAVPPGAEFGAFLIDVAEKERAELIVIGVRRRRPVGKLLLGSHVQRIVLEAACPVLAVKSDLPRTTA